MSYKFKFNPDSNSSKESNSIIVKDPKNENFWDSILDMLPTPEEEIKNMIKDEEKLEELIKETKEVLEKIEIALLNSQDECNEELQSLKSHYTSLLETFESELQFTKFQHKSMDNILKSEDSDEELNIPELLANSIVSTRKKMEDVNDVVKSIEKNSKKNRIEECIYCFTTVKDEHGRKASVKHIHINNKFAETFKKYKPVICMDCFDKNIKTELISKDEIIFEDEDKIVDSTCKKGSKIYSYELKKEISSNLPMFEEKIKKYVELEKNNFLNSLKSEEKKSFFDLKI